MGQGVIYPHYTYTTVTFELFQILARLFYTWSANKFYIRTSHCKYHVTSATFMTSPEMQKS